MKEPERQGPVVQGGRSGFVVAMRAHISRPGCEHEAEWIIVSRWGRGGEFLSLARTLVPAPHGAPLPIGLAPRQTALATSTGPAGSRRAVHFALVRNLPGDIVVAGRFLVLQGVVTLLVRGENLRLIGKGSSAVVGPWRLQAQRVRWADEFFADDRFGLR